MAGPKKILVVEDEKPMARALELKLTKAGFEVKKSGNGEGVLEMLQDEHFDLVLTDLIMPKMNGFALLEQLQKQHLTTPVIILSNLSQEEDEAKAKALGAKEFFVKSNTTIANVVEAVETILK